MDYQFPHDANEYELLYKIGHDFISDVYAARCKTNGQIIAIKIISMDAYPIDVTDFRKGNSIWISTSHEYLVKYYGSFEVGSSLWILREFMDGGSIGDIMKYAYRHGFKDETLIASILKPVLEFLVSFHQDYQIHRSIGTSQILISHDGTVKLSNLSFSSSLIEHGKRKATRSSFSYGSSPKETCYLAPEVLTDSGYSQKADVWSIGITAIELATGNLPFDGLNELEKISSIISGPPPNLYNCSPKRDSVMQKGQSGKNREFSSLFIDFIEKCLNKSPDKRPTVKGLLEHKFFRILYSNLNIPLNQVNTSEQTKTYLHRVLMAQLPSLKDRCESLNKFESKEQENNPNQLPEKHLHFRKAESSKRISEYLSGFFDSDSLRGDSTQSMDRIPILHLGGPKQAHQPSSFHNHSILLNSYDFIFDDIDELTAPASYGPSKSNHIMQMPLIENEIDNNSALIDNCNQNERTKKRHRSKIHKENSTATIQLSTNNFETNHNSIEDINPLSISTSS